MANFKLTPYERETLISFSDESDHCEVYTHDKKLIRRLKKLCKDHPDAYNLDWKDEYSHAFSTTKNRITFTKPRKVSLTNEQRQAAAERMRNLRERILEEKVIKETE